MSGIPPDRGGYTRSSHSLIEIDIQDKLNNLTRLNFVQNKLKVSQLQLKIVYGKKLPEEKCPIQLKQFKTIFEISIIKSWVTCSGSTIVDY